MGFRFDNWNFLWFTSWSCKSLNCMKTLSNRFLFLSCWLSWCLYCWLCKYFGRFISWFGFCFYGLCWLFFIQILLFSFLSWYWFWCLSIFPLLLPFLFLLLPQLFLLFFILSFLLFPSCLFSLFPLWILFNLGLPSFLSLLYSSFRLFSFPSTLLFSPFSPLFHSLSSLILPFELPSSLPLLLSTFSLDIVHLNYLLFFLLKLILICLDWFLIGLYMLRKHFWSIHHKLLSSALINIWLSFT